MDSLAAMERGTMKIKGQTFENDSVILDGNDFMDCTFDKCELIIRGTDEFGIHRCTFNVCTYNFQGQAGAVLEFLDVLLSGNEKDDRHFLSQILPHVAQWVGETKKPKKRGRPRREAQHETS